MRRLLSHTTWPLVLVAGTYGVYRGFRSDYPLAAVFFAVNLAMMAFVVLVEQIAPYRRDWNALTDRQSINDLAHALVQNQVGERLGDLLFLTLATALAARLTTLAGFSVWPTGWPVLLQIGLVTLVGDGLDYAKHRLVHTVPWLWRVHALHHGVSRFHVFKAGRLHFIEVLMRFALVFSPLAIAGAPPEIILWYAAFIPIFGIVGHSNVDVRTPSVVHRLLMTPQVHRLHHSIERTTSDTNYANIFPIWDVLFGTFRHPDRHRVDQVGVVGDPIPSGFVGQFLSPFTWGHLVKQP